MKNVERWTVVYEILRFPAVIINRLANRYITITGKENVPKNEPVFLAPNHQNALLDPMAITTTTGLQPVFLARADIFKNKFFAWFLKKCKVSPVYRIRDGKDSLEKNQEVFENGGRILLNKRVLAVFPEAAHSGMKSMLPHKKGIPRIVFPVAESTNFELDIKIVPVGINYSHYYKFRRSLQVNFGKPISSKDYYEMYQEEGNLKTSNVLRKDLFKAIQELVIHVPNKNDYDLYDEAFQMFNPHFYNKLGLKQKESNFYKAEKKLVDKITGALRKGIADKDELLKAAKSYKTIKTKFGLSEKAIRKGETGGFTQLMSYLLFLVCTPFTLLGTVLHGWLFYLSRYPLRKKMKDSAFWSSIAYGVNYLVYPIYLIALFFIINAFVGTWYYTILIILLSFPSGILAWTIGQVVFETNQRAKIRRLVKSTEMISLYALRGKLMKFYLDAIKD